MKAASPTRVHIWLPDLLASKGGIQVFSQFFVDAVAEILPQARLSIFAKNDQALPVWPQRPNPTVFRCVGWWGPRLRSAAFTTLLAKQALADRPRLILMTHVHYTPVARWLKRFTSAPYLAVAHGVDVWGVDRPSLQRGLRGADRLLAVSHYTRDRLHAEQGVAAERVGILPNTFDEQRFVPGPKPRYLLKRYGLRPDQPVILTVARLASAERYKGYDQILRALPAIRQSIPDVRYVLGGRGPDRPRLESLIRELKLEANVILAGFIPDHELCDHYNSCDVFAMPSKGEGFGIVYLEAMACGKPTLAGNKDGSVDALLNGKLGVLVDPDEIAAISGELTRILKRAHPLAILQQPEKLRQGVLDAYGYTRFTEILRGHLEQLGLQTSR